MNKPYVHGIASIPKSAKRISDDMYHLGKRMHKGVEVTGYAHLHRRKEKQSTKNKASNLCFGFLAYGARWKVTKNYGISTVNNQGIPSSQVLTAVQAGISVWDQILSTFTIFGNYDSTIIVNGADFDQPDGEYLF